MKHLAALSPGFWVQLRNAKMRGLEHLEETVFEIKRVRDKWREHADTHSASCLRETSASQIAVIHETGRLADARRCERKGVVENVGSEVKSEPQ